MTSRLPFRAVALSAPCWRYRQRRRLRPTCGTGSFDAWLDDFKTEAAAKGISQSAIAAGLNGVTLDQSGAVARSFAEGLQPEF